MLLGIEWYHFISNDEVWCQTNQSLLVEITLSRRLTLFGHIAWMDDNIDAKQILTSSPSVYWKRLPGWPGRRRCRTTSTPTGRHRLKQSTSPRTDHSGDCWRLVALHTHSGAGRRWWWWWWWWLSLKSVWEVVKFYCPMWAPGLWE